MMCILFVALCCWSAVESKMFSNVSLTFNNLQSFASGCLLLKLWHRYTCVDLITYNSNVMASFMLVEKFKKKGLLFSGAFVFKVYCAAVNRT